MKQQHAPEGAQHLSASAALLEAVGDAVLAVDLLGRIVVWNEAAAVVTGWPTERAVGRHLSELIDAPYTVEVDEALVRVLAGRGWTLTIPLCSPDGRRLTIDVLGEPVTADGSVVGTVAVLRAVTSEQVERRLRQLNALLLYSPDALTVCDRDGQVVEWSAAAERMFGWTRAEMLDSDSMRLVPPEDHEQFRTTWAAVADGQDVPPFEAVRLDRHGVRRTVNVHFGAVREQGRFAGVVATFRDLSERQLRDRQLTELLNSVPLAVAAYDLDGKVTFAAGGGLSAAGIDPDVAYGVSLLETSPTGTAVHDAVHDSLRGRTRDFQVMFDDRPWRCHSAPVLESGMLTGGFVVGLDVTEQQQSEDRLADTLDAAPLCLVCFDADGVITYAAGSGYRASGLEPASTVGVSMLEMYGDSVQVADAIGQCLNGRNVDLATALDGRIWDLHYRSHLTANGQPNGGVVMAQDATGWLAAVPQQREPADPTPGAELTAVAVDTAQSPEPLVGFLERDELTGLLGRRGLQRALRALSAADAETAVAVALADVDAFSLVNETYGYDVGDDVLRQLARRVTVVTASATAGRWGADEFVVVTSGAHAEARVRELAEAILETTRAPLTVGELQLHLTVSVGVVSTATTPHGDLVGAASLAVRAAQRAGRNRIEQFSPSMRPGAGGAMKLAVDLRRAIAGDELRLHYQPIVDLSSGRPVAVEALVRWQHPDRGLLAPSEFIDIAERTGLVVPLGEWVLHEACRTAASWAARGEHALRIAVNLSARQLSDGDILSTVQSALNEHGCRADQLVFEVTETALMTDMTAAVTSLTALRALGARLAIDDFGTSYASMFYLKHLPADKIKIDMSFVSGLGTNPDDTAIVASLISLAHNVNMRCVAEGVETADQLELLTQLGCDFAQGYLFSRPVDAVAVESWLDQQLLTPHHQAPPAPRSSPESARIMAMHEAGASLHTIAAALNMDGNWTARGSRWSAQSVARIVARAQFPSIGLGV